MRVDGKTTNAGWRKIKAQAKDYVCGCGARVRYYWTKCPACSHPRPEEG
jgi:hypothetical protein